MRCWKVLAIFALATMSAFAGSTSRRVVVSLADHKLALVEDGRMVKVYPVAVGKSNTPSPTGTFEIVARVVDPIWYGPHTVLAPGPANPLGTRWMGLSYKGFGIHGTNAPQSVGKSASHGCIRMRKHDIEELFDLVRVGDPVEMVNEASGELAKLFETPAPPAKLTRVSTPRNHPAAQNGGVRGGRL